MAKPTTPSTLRLSDIARHVVYPSSIVRTDWGEVVGKCRQLGIEFDAWQHGAGQVILGTDAEGIYATTVGGSVLSIPRQVGKTFLIGSIMFALCLLRPGMTVIWTAHRMKTAGETFASMQAMSRQKRIAPHIAAVYTGAGDEEVRFKNGSRILFGARERGFGRGFSEVDAIVFDEAQILTENAIDDMVPAANAAPNPLLLYMGTPPKPSDPSEVFAAKRSDALSGESDDTVYIEFSADEDADFEDRAQWRKANPSYPGRTSEAAMLRMKKNLTPESFRREAMGIWDSKQAHERVISQGAWDDLAIEPEAVPLDPPAAFGLSMSPERVAYIGVAVGDGDETHVELAERGRMDDSRQLVDWFVKAAGRRTVVYVDTRDPAASLVGDLRARKVRVNVTTASDAGKACGGLLDAVVEGRLTHLGQVDVDEALAKAKKKPLGKAGLWEWDGDGPLNDPAPLRAITLARFGASLRKKPSGSRSGREAVVLA